MRMRLLICVWLLAASQSAISQQIEVCGVKVSIGDERERIERDIGGHCKILRHPEKEVTFYRGVARSRSESQGEIWFKDGKVTSASLPSSTFRDAVDPVAVMKTFTEALQAAYDVAGPPAKISTTVIPIPDAKMTVTNVVFKGRRVSVLLKEGGKLNGQDVAITESIIGED